MICGYDEAKEVDGRFYEFKYRVFVKRTARTERFECFKDNDLQVFEYDRSVFCHNESDFNHLINEAWRDGTGTYSYASIGQEKPVKSYTASDVVQLIYDRFRFKFLCHYCLSGSIEYLK